MIVEAGCSWARASGSLEEMEWLDAYMSCETERYRPGARGFNSYSKERFSLLGMRLPLEVRRRLPTGDVVDRFPSGVVPLLVEAAARDGVTLQVRDLRPPAPCKLDLGVDLSWLRSDQRDAAVAMAVAERGLLSAPTGAGKSRVLSALTCILPCEWAFLVHRVDLVGQMAEKHEAVTGVRAGTISSAGWKRGSGRFTVATPQTIEAGLLNREPAILDFVQRCQGVLVDEVHSQSGDSFMEATMAFENARYRFGVSGTPLKRGERAALMTVGAIGPVVHRIPRKLLEDLGVLARCLVRMVPCEQADPAILEAKKRWEQEVLELRKFDSVAASLMRFRAPERSWRQVYNALIVGSAARNDLLAEICNRAAKPCMVFVDETRQGDDLESRIIRWGLRCFFVHGGHSLDRRRGALKDLASGRIDVCLTSPIFTEGIDVPALRSVVIGGAKQSTVALIQQLGRGARGALKSEFELWDVLDKGQRWLHRHAVARRKRYESEGHRVIVGWPEEVLAGASP